MTPSTLAKITYLAQRAAEDDFEGWERKGPYSGNKAPFSVSLLLDAAAQATTAIFTEAKIRALALHED